jgi:hypothetical protein
LAWLEVHQSLKDHRKTLAAADRLDINPASMMGHLVSLWLWALDNAPDGNIIAIMPRTIARAAQWEGDPKLFIDTLVNENWLDEADGGLLIHDWYDYAGKLIEKRLSERDRTRNRRKNVKKEIVSDVLSADSPRTDHGQTTDKQPLSAGTVQYTTVHNTTAQNRTTKPPVAPQGGAGAVGEQGENLTVETARGADSENSVDQSMTLVQQRFVVFWAAYPKKSGKGAAEKSWDKIKPTEKLFTGIMNALEAAKQCDQWLRENGRYIPNPATWLNQKRWEDEYTPAVHVSSQPRPNGKPDTLGVLMSMMDSEEMPYDEK